MLVHYDRPFVNDAAGQLVMLQELTFPLLIILSVLFLFGFWVSSALRVAAWTLANILQQSSSIIICKTCANADEYSKIY